MWRFTGKKRPVFAIELVEGQESVWDYPRPPVCVEDSRVNLVRHNENLIAQSVKPFASWKGQARRHSICHRPTSILICWFSQRDVRFASGKVSLLVIYLLSFEGITTTRSASSGNF